MNNTDLVTQILRSPEAKRMRWMVTQGFYDRSRIGLWMMEVIGREYDDMAYWARNIRLEAFIQTCTWSIGIWEWLYGVEPDDTLPLEFRRGRILSKKLQRPPVNPARIEAILTALTGVPVTITENVAPYTFGVELDESALPAGNLEQMYALLRTIKPSHLSFTTGSMIIVTFTVTDCSAAAEAVLLREYFTESGAEIQTGTEDFTAAAVADLFRDLHIEPGGPIGENATDYYGGTVYERTREQTDDGTPIATTASDYNGAAAYEKTKEAYTDNG